LGVDEEPPEFEDNDDVIKLGQLEQAIQKGEAWDDDDRKWVVTTLKKAWEELGEAQMPDDPSGRDRDDE
jgi:hypothetical protein